MRYSSVPSSRAVSYFQEIRCFPMLEAEKEYVWPCAGATAATETLRAARSRRDRNDPNDFSEDENGSTRAMCGFMTAPCRPNKEARLMYRGPSIP